MKVLQEAEAWFAIKQARFLHGLIEFDCSSSPLLVIEAME